MIPGIDISMWQTNDARNLQYFFDPKVAEKKGINFAFIKASERMSKDPAVDHFGQSFAESNIPFGFYHFARPSAYGSNPAQQAERFYEIIKGHKWSIPPVLDVEADGVGLSFIKMFMETLEGLLPDGVIPIIYSGPGFLGGLKGIAQAYWIKKYPLFIANYFKSHSFPVYHIPDNVINSTTLPVVPKPWDTWTFWQYAQVGDGEFYGGDYAKHTDKTALDMDVFNGDLMEFCEFIGAGEIEDPPIPSFENYVEVIAESFLRLRPEAVYNTNITTLIVENGEVLQIAGASIYEPSSGITWLPVFTPARYSGEFIGYVSANKKYVKYL